MFVREREEKRERDKEQLSESMCYVHDVVLGRIKQFKLKSGSPNNTMQVPGQSMYG